LIAPFSFFFFSFLLYRPSSVMLIPYFFLSLCIYTDAIHKETVMGSIYFSATNISIGKVLLDTPEERERRLAE
jgi:hypothetical protein